VRTDSFGFTHPEPQDKPDLLGALHIAECGECHKRFGPGIAQQCEDLADAWVKERQSAPLAL
jgi:hypothetical protein